jgi:hypothetical protein
VGSEEASEVYVEDLHTAERSETESEAESEDGRDCAGDDSINSSSSEGEWDDTVTARASSKKRKADGLSEEEEEEDGQSETEESCKNNAEEEEDSDNDSLCDASELDAISKGELSKMMSSKEEEEEEGNDTHTALIKAADQENKKRCTPRRSSRAPKPVEYNDFGEVVEEDEEGVPGSDDDNDNPDGNHLSLISFQQCTCIFNCGVYDVFTIHFDYL